MEPKLTLVSHHLCPYVQRVAIILLEANIAFDRIDIDLADKPDWFLVASPLGKTPLLMVNQEVVFESAVICDYLVEAYPDLSFYDQSPLVRAQQRAWVAYASELLNAIAAFYSASDQIALEKRASIIRERVSYLNDHLSHQAFLQPSLSMLDAAFAPAFRYFDVFDKACGYGFLNLVPGVKAWWDALKIRPSVMQAVSSDYPEALQRFLKQRDSELSKAL